MTDVGGIGEGLLRVWAAQVDLIANPSKEKDASGWDFLIEWPFRSSLQPESGPILLDRAPAPLQALVQVKSTEVDRERWQVKLSNWRRLAWAPLPAFFLVFEVAAGEATAAYLVHVDKEQLRRVLERLREEELKGTKLDELHQHWLDLKWSESDRLDALNGAALEKAMRLAIGTSMEQYLDARLENLRTLGYEDATEQMTATFVIPEGEQRSPRDLLIDFSLGLVPELRTEEAVVHDVRFGMLSPEPINRLGPGTLEVERIDSIGRGTLVLRRSDSDEALELTAKTYGAAAAQSLLPPGQLRVRYAIPFLNVVFDLGSPNNALHIRFNIPDVAVEHPIAELRPAARFVDFVARALAEGAAVSMEIFFEGARVGRASLAGVGALAAALRDWAQLVNNAWTVARAVELDDARVRVDELAAHRGDLQWLHSLLGPPPLYVRVGFTVDNDSVIGKRPVCIPRVASLPLGEHVVELAFAIVGDAKTLALEEDGGRRMQLDTQDVRRHRRRVIPRASTDPSAHATLTAEINAQHEADFDIVTLVD